MNVVREEIQKQMLLEVISLLKATKNRLDTAEEHEVEIALVRSF